MASDSSNEESVVTSPSNINGEEQLFGLIGGMLDRNISQFDYRGMTVFRTSESIGVSPTGEVNDMRGGRMLLDSATIQDVLGWLQAKSQFYGVKA